MATPPLSKKFMFEVAMLLSNLNFFSRPPGAFSASSSLAPLKAVTVNETCEQINQWVRGAATT